MVSEINDAHVTISSNEGDFFVGYPVNSKELFDSVIYVPDLDIYVKGVSHDQRYFEQISNAYIITTSLDEFLHSTSDFLTHSIKTSTGKLASTRFVKQLTGLGLKDCKCIVDDVVDNTYDFFQAYKYIHK
jgi:hypothetical protein